MPLHQAPPPTAEGGEEDETGECVEVGNFTRFVGPVLDFGREGVEELLTICVTGLEGLGFNVTLCPLLEVIVEGTPVTLIFKIVKGCDDGVEWVLVVDVLIGDFVVSDTFGEVLTIGAGVVLETETFWSRAK